RRRRVADGSGRMFVLERTVVLFSVGASARAAGSMAASPGGSVGPSGESALGAERSSDQRFERLAGARLAALVGDQPVQVAVADQDGVQLEGELRGVQAAP